MKIFIYCLILLFIACSDKQSSDVGEKELNENFKGDFVNSKYVMNLGDAAWEALYLQRLKNGKYVLTFSIITPNQSKDCILEGEGRQKGNRFYFKSSPNSLEILLIQKDEELVISGDKVKISQVCGKDHHALGTYELAQ
ncbi:hypothetical protein BKH41_02150 [Helicobacter sp. 12S02232-10]|uniref:hypothetical protein n=1 Tax=Helicobacter sp. 12S02232-10 TaxID=1476197 RepID=UPI000BA5B419|nr:hypothetical protein [Helicobacter sp. 12S02232-10]PAF49489.1 hypothetical protein BKH41_02150 [Helicobacter sp. 12S02232-10]